MRDSESYEVADCNVVSLGHIQIRVLIINSYRTSQCRPRFNDRTPSPAALLGNGEQTVGRNITLAHTHDDPRRFRTRQHNTPYFECRLEDLAIGSRSGAKWRKLVDYSIIVADVAAAAHHHSFGQCRIAPIQTRDDSLKKDAATRAQDDFMAVGNQFSSDEFVRKSTQFGQEVIDAVFGGP